MQINVRVTAMDAELEFAIQPNTTGKQLFDQVYSLHSMHNFDTCVHAVAYFFLCFSVTFT